LSLDCTQKHGDLKRLQNWRVFVCDCNLLLLLRLRRGWWVGEQRAKVTLTQIRKSEVLCTPYALAGAVVSLRGARFVDSRYALVSFSTLSSILLAVLTQVLQFTLQVLPLVKPCSKNEQTWPRWVWLFSSTKSG